MNLNHPQDLASLASDVELTIYTLSFCPWCYRAKVLMRDAGIRYVEKPGPRPKSGVVPEIFDGDHLIGGIAELEKFIEDFQS